jgi:hypothetical protein
MGDHPEASPNTLLFPTGPNFPTGHDRSKLVNSKDLQKEVKLDCSPNATQLDPTCRSLERSSGPALSAPDPVKREGHRRLI